MEQSLDVIDAAPDGDAHGLLERHAELAEISQLLDDSRSGKGGAMLVEGPAGIGKSRLLAAARREAAARGMELLAATGSELEREFTFGACLQLFEGRLRAAPADERASLLSGAAGLAEPLLQGRLGFDGAQRGAMPIHHGLFWLTCNLSERRPVLIAVDDAHWADGPSLSFLVYLLQRLEGLRVAVAVAVRSGAPQGPHDLVAELACHRSVRRVRPAALSEEAAGALVRGRAPGADAVFCRACAHATGGNPFLLRELLDGLEADGVAPTAQGAARVGRFAPESVRRTVAARLARMAGGCAELARAVAVLGPDASVTEAAALAGLTADDAACAADALAAAGVLAVGAPLAFVHPLVRSAVYDETPAAARARLHVAAARLLADAAATPERIAAHLLAGSTVGEPWAAQALRAAARRALADGTPDAAARYLRRALEEPAGGALRANVLLELGRAEALSGEPAAAEHLAAAAELAEDPLRRGRVLLELGETLYHNGHLQPAGEAFQRGVEVVGGRDRELEANLRAGWASVARLDPRLRPRVQQYLAEVLDHSGEEATHGERRIVVHAAEQLVFAGEPRDRAVALLRRALGDGALLAVESSEGPMWFLAVSNLGWCDEFDDYDREVEAGLADARRRGSVWGFANASFLRAFSGYYAGRIAESIADAQHAIDAGRSGWQRFLPAAHMQLSWALMERGELDAAERVLAAVEGDACTSRSSMWALVVGARARLELMRGRAEEAFDRFELAGRIATDGMVENPAIVAPWRSSAALAAAACGKRARALELAQEEIALARRFGAPRPVGVALRAAGVVEGGDRGLALLDEAVHVLERSPAALELARALIDLGAALRRANRRAAAREPLRRGLDMAHRFGALVLERAAREELLATGARPRRILLTGVESLTPSERRVAQLAAGGLSNREIAQALFVTLKTVEAHMSNAFRKLDVSGREQLGAALA